jgi:hypothetical protein
MKTKLHYLFIVLALFAGVYQTFAQGTAFTYQGQLQNNGSPAGGNYNLTFSLFNTNAGGVAIVGPVTTNGVIVTNGLFTVLIDFGSDAFIGGTNWLQIGVETNGFGSFTTLTPRQKLTPVPDAIYAENADILSGTLSASQLTSIGNVSGSDNFFIGPSGNSTMSGIANTAIGDFALLVNTSGGDNTAGGYDTLRFNTSGSYNTAYGMYALSYNTNGNGNTAIGFESLQGFGNTSGSYNIALGYQAGFNIINGSSDIDIGNEGVAGDNNIIRIGSGQTDTFIAGVITNTGTLTLQAETDMVFVAGNNMNLTADTNMTVKVGADTTLNTGNNMIVTVAANTTLNTGINMNVTADENMNLTAANDMEVTASGAMTLKSDTIMMLNSPASEITGNVGIGTNATTNPLEMGSGAYCSVAGVWTSVSDRNAKEDFAAIKPAEVLARVVALPITEWKYKVEANGTEHLGPMAQDFHAAFHLNGADDRHISVVDEGGVALAAIQGLNQKLNEKDAEIQNLEKRLDELQAVVKQLAANK